MAVGRTRCSLAPIFFSLLLCGSMERVLGEGTEDSSTPNEFLIMTVATEKTDGYERFMRSLQVYDLDKHVKVLGMGEDWCGGDVARYAGGGHKVNLLKRGLQPYKDNREMVVMFTDSYDVIVLSGMKSLLQTFKRFNARVVFSAEGFCWPDQALAAKYPKVDSGKKYLNSGGFMGYASDLYQIVSSSELENDGDDQLFYTHIFLDKKLREKYKIKLDHRSKIFQNLNGATDEVEIDFATKGTAYLSNMVAPSRPLVVHGNGASKSHLNYLGNYLAKSYNFLKGCLTCNKNLTELKESSTSLPVVMLALLVEEKTPFLDQFLEYMAELDYPKSQMHLFLHLSTRYHAGDCDSFVKTYGHEFRSVKYLKPEDKYNDWEIRNQAVEECLSGHDDCDFLFAVDAVSHLTNPNTLRALIRQNKGILSPSILRNGKLWSNFWGAINEKGFYSRSKDYLDIVNGERKGVWNVPYLNSAILMKKSHLRKMHATPFIHSSLDQDMAFSTNMRDAGIFMYVMNLDNYGYLINRDGYETKGRLYPDLWGAILNPKSWERRYLHENYTTYLEMEEDLPMPCQDVFWFPFTSARWCNEIVESMEDYGQWSGGKHEDARLSGGYENVPTRDIHMRQIGYEPEWLQMLKEYVDPVQRKAFIGFYHYPPNAHMNFVVRYKPEEQASLRPHHDSSTFTVNLALNRVGVDYEGGGSRFIRYNCSVTQTKLGWAFLHPGRLTHYHEGLPTTKGTRYIMVSFVDP